MNFTNSRGATPLPNPPPQGREQVRNSDGSVVWSTNQIFAANRAVSRVDVAIDNRNGVTRLRHVREEGSLRIRFPRTISDELEAVLVNTAGGIAGGDDLELRFAAGPDTRTVVTGAAAEKIYRSPGAEANIDGLHLVAEGTTGRRNRIDTVLVSRVGDGAQPAEHEERQPADA